MDKEDVVYIYIYIYININIYIYLYIYTQWILAIKKNEVMPFAATWMDLEIIILSEVSQTEKDKYHMISITYMWNLKNDMNKSIYKTETDSQI